MGGDFNRDFLMCLDGSTFVLIEEPNAEFLRILLFGVVKFR